MTDSLSPSLDTPMHQLCRQGRFAEALALFEAGNEPGLDTPEAALLAAMAAARIGNFDAAWRLVTAALTRVTRSHDRDGQLQALNLMGGISLERGDLTEAEVAFNQAARVASDLGNRMATAAAWNNLGILAHLRRHPLPAIELFKRALEVYRPVGEAVGMARTQHNLALALRDLGEYDRADRHLTEAHGWAEQASDDGLRGLIMMGRVELDIARRDLDRAGQDLEAAEHLARMADDQFGLGEAARLRGLLALQQRRFAAALTATLTGLRIADAIGAKLLRAECEALHALALDGLGKHEEAEREHVHAMDALRQIGADRLFRRLEQAWNRRPHT